MEIKILGPGCTRCQATERNVKEAVKELGIDTKMEKVTDPVEISKHGVFSTPAVIVDGKVKCTGKVPKTEEIKSWF
jgi:small redox-active disulfide protein 2